MQLCRIWIPRTSNSGSNLLLCLWESKTEYIWVIYSKVWPTNITHKNNKLEFCYETSPMRRTCKIVHQQKIKPNSAKKKQNSRPSIANFENLKCVNWLLDEGISFKEIISGQIWLNDVTPAPWRDGSADGGSRWSWLIVPSNAGVVREKIAPSRTNTQHKLMCDASWLQWAQIDVWHFKVNRTFFKENKSHFQE